MELAEIQRLQEVRNVGALRTLHHEKAADDLLTSASELLKRVEGK